LFLAKFHFAPTCFFMTKIGNEIASASAFPSATWERGTLLFVHFTNTL
jgi:hypothetical protein